MTRAPTVVLLYVNTNDLLSADHICLPFISEDEPDSKTKAIMARARQSLLRVHDKKLEKQKLACLNSIK